MKELWQPVVVAVLIAAWAPLAPGESIITYESYDDLTPDDPSIDVCLDCTATIEIWITPTDGIPTTIGAAGFDFEYDVLRDGDLINGGIVLSDYSWSEPFQMWLLSEDFPQPETVNFHQGSVPVPVEGLLLSTLTVTGDLMGLWNQPTDPIMADEDIAPIPLAEGSDNFDVSVGFEFCLDGGGDPDPEDDCNENDIHDICDVINGTSQDCNSNGVPDECDVADGSSDDCNENIVPDECETELDCNGNQRPDECDLEDGTSDDCNENNVPDECEPELDCNNNQRPDECDVDDGTSGDCNENGVPDECDIASGESEDGDMDGFPDECGPAYPFLFFWDCVTGAGGGVETGCEPFDMDRDDDVDLIDYGWFQIVHAGCGVVIRQQPGHQNPCIGQDAHFEVQAAGALLSYQWHVNGQPIEGEDGPTFNVFQVDEEDNGAYHCEVTSSCGGFAPSSTAELFVNVASPEFELHPESASVCAGEDHLMFVSASGLPGYQWLRDNQPIAGATQFFYAIIDAGPDDAGDYFVVAYNGCGLNVSETATIDVIDCGSP